MAEPDPALGQRLLSAAILGPIVLALVFVDLWSFALLAAVGVLLLALEWRRLTMSRFDPKSGDLAGVTAGGVALVVLGLTLFGMPVEALAACMAGVLAAWLLARLQDAPPLWISFGVLYLGLPTLALIWLRAIPAIGLGMVIWLLLVVWTTDVAAYFVGRNLGGPRLAPSISPAKTWSGLAGGMISAAIIGGALAYATRVYPLLFASLVAGVLALLAQLGDLTESALKRRAGLKDVSGLIPGHGGLFDRVDGLLFAAPALALLAWLIGMQGRL